MCSLHVFQFSLLNRFSSLRDSVLPFVPFPPSSQRTVSRECGLVFPFPVFPDFSLSWPLFLPISLWPPGDEGLTFPSEIISWFSSKASLVYSNSSIQGEFPGDIRSVNSEGCEVGFSNQVDFCPFPHVFKVCDSGLASRGYLSTGNDMTATRLPAWRCLVAELWPHADELGCPVSLWHVCAQLKAGCLLVMVVYRKAMWFVTFST